jgi:diadenosine tetraphosphatase ApaH/serine/threonine PP2A family protein phosphatase
MRIAVISDVHANLAALEAVLADMDGRADEVFSLGDNIGYGPDPEAVLRVLEARGIPSVMGNHELGLVRGDVLARFNPSARRSLEITRDHLSTESLKALADLPGFITREGCRFVHGAPPDSCQRYLFELSDTQLRSCFEAMNETVCFVGHTHDLEMVFPRGDRIHREGLPRGTVSLPDECRAIFNIGSVGQPRDGDNRAKYVVYDTGERTLEVRFVDYDIGATVERILKLGMPEINAHRLW